MAKNLHRQRTPMSEQLRLITECRQSGLTDADWCRENGVNPSTFYSWLARCRKSACSAQIPPAGYGHSARPEPRQDVVAIELFPDQLPESAAVPLPDQPETHLDNSHTIEIVWKGVTLRLTNRADAGLLARALCAIREAVC